MQHWHVNTALKTTDGIFLAEFIARDQTQIETFENQLKPHALFQTQHILSTQKQEGFLTE